MKLEITAAEKGKFDVIVVGGGIAGVAAAVSAARSGASVLLMEKSANLGGLATGGLISWYEPLCDGKGNQLITGMAEELIRLACQYGFDNLPPKWGGAGQNPSRNGRFSTFYSPGVFSAALDRFVLESGATLRFDTLCTRPVMQGHRCAGVIAESESGSEFFEAHMVIDATGSASILHRAGAPTVSGRNYMTYIAHGFTLADAQKLSESGDVCAFRKWMNVGSDMLGNGHPENMPPLAGTTAEEITDYLIQGKARLLDRIAAMDKNGFDLMSIPAMPQLRTIRRLAGETDFCAVDGQTFADSIGTCGDFRPQGVGKRYQIPFGALHNRAYPNLLAAGRIISSPEGDGWEVARVIPVCALTGEAAGKAAALCARENRDLSCLQQADWDLIRVN